MGDRVGFVENEPLIDGRVCRALLDMGLGTWCRRWWDSPLLPVSWVLQILWTSCRHTTQAHDEHDDCNVGDTVRVHISRPLSKRKCWVVTQILHRARVFDAGEWLVRTSG